MGKAKAVESSVFEGIDVSKFDAEAISNGLEHANIAPSGTATLEVRAALLKKHFDELAAEPKLRAPGVGIADCDNCGAASTNDLDVCPFCGVGEEALEEEPSGETQAPPPPEEDIPEPDFDSVEVPAPELEAPAVEPAPPSPVEGQKLTKKERKKGALAVVPSVVDGVIDPSLSPLDKFVAEIKYLRRATEVGGYMLAKRLAEGEISGVWKTRLDAKQKAAYKNFGAFAQIELGMSEHYVRDQLKLYARFTEEQFKAIGPTKLRLVIQVSPDAQPKMLEKIKGGASKRDLEREMGRKGKDALGAKGAKLEIAKSGKVTLAVVEGRQKFAFFAKPEKKGDEPKPAKRIGQSPWGRLPISINDVEVLVTVTLNKRGEFEGVCEVRRVDPTK